MKSPTPEPKDRDRPITGAAPVREAGKLVARARARELVLREKLQRLAREDHRQGRRYQRQYLNSFDAKLSALHEANKKQPGKPLGDTDLVRLAGKLNPWKGTDERARLRPEPTASGYRPITAFGIENAGLQTLVGRAAEPFIRFHPAQYDVAGNGGNEGACRRLLELLRGGYVHVLVADVAANFNSLGAGGLTQMLPIPRAITERVVLARNLNVTNGKERRRGHASRASGPRCADAPEVPVPISPTLRVIATLGQGGKAQTPSRLKETLRKGRQGTSQGSVSSPLVSGCVHAPIVRNISELAPTVHYVDNYHVVAKAGDELLPIAKALKAEFNRSPAGPLLFSKCEIKDARRGFVTLGWEFKAKDGRAWVRPPKHKLERHYLKFLEMVDDLALGIGTPKGVRESLRGWCASARLWPHVGLWKKLLLARLATEVGRSSVAPAAPSA